MLVARLGRCFIVFVATQVALMAPLYAISNDEAVKAVKQAKILAPDSQVVATVSGEEVSISTFKHPNALETDLKIDAVLVAKKLMDEDPSLARVKVFFYDTTNRNHYRCVEVRVGDIKAFAAGGVSQKKLLASIGIAKGSRELQPVAGFAGLVKPKLLEGPYLKMREDLLEKIWAQRNSKLAVKQYLDEFSALQQGIIEGKEEHPREALIRLFQEFKGQWQRVHAPSGLPGRPGLGRATEDQLKGDWQPPPRGFRAGTAYWRARLGNLTPVVGPAFEQRCRIALRISELKNSHQVTDAIQQQFRALERMVTQGEDTRQVDRQVMALSKLLGIDMVTQPRIR